MRKSEWLLSVCRNKHTHTHACMRSYMQKKKRVSKHTGAFVFWSSHTDPLHVTLLSPCETHTLHTCTQTNTHCPLTPLLHTLVYTVSNASIHITVQYPGGTQRKTRNRFPFIFMGPCIHSTMMSAQRWAEKKDLH